MPAAGPRSVPADPAVPVAVGRNAISVGVHSSDELEVSPSEAPKPRSVAWLAERPVLAVVAVAISTAAAVMVASAGLSAWQDRSGPPVEDLLPIVSPVVPIPTATVVVVPVDHIVHVAGAVRSPGVVRVPEGSRVIDALDAAGGPAADADLDRLNLAAMIVDGERVHVPLVGEEPPSVINSGSSQAPGATDATRGPVEINIATGPELESLNGVGPATAAAILDFRDRNGPFVTIDDLLDVPGIGPAKLEGLRSQVTVGP